MSHTMWHYLLHNLILFCTTDDGWWFIRNMSWLTNMNFKNIAWFVKAITIIIIIIIIVIIIIVVVVIVIVISIGNHMVSSSIWN